ncbi:MAG: flagellar hook-length control protein FliK [Polaromonas sp.]
MSNLTALVDTLLATRLAQRVDLVPLKPEVAIAGPGAVAQVEEIANDVRQPSRAAMLQQLGVGVLTDADPTSPSSASALLARPGENVTLSVAARAVSVILDASSGIKTKITGAEPLWPKAQPPLAPVLSATLARTVANSGLFYESHLAQFAAGTRTLAQLAQEPQGRLDATAKVALALPAANPATQASGVAGLVPVSSGLVHETQVVPNATVTAASPLPVADGADAAEQSGGVIVTLSGGGRLAEANGLPGAATLPAANDEAAVFSGKPGAAAALPHPVPGGLASGPDSAGFQQGGDLAHVQKNAYLAIQQADGQEPAAKNHLASALDASRNAPGLAGIHPDAVALVRQQLELLALPVFRWGGEASPGVPMDWEIHEEPEERQATSESEAVPRTWSTRVALTLPTLKQVEVRISLAGTTLKVHLAASETATREVMGEARTELPKRFAELGLQLTGLEIGMLAAASAAQAMPKDADAR